MPDTREDFIAALRHVASVLENNPDIRIPYFGTQVVRCESIEDFRKNIEAYGGHWTKSSDGDNFEMNQKLHENLSIMLYASHSQVCERVVVDVKHIPEVVLPAQPERTIPERNEEIVKWVCPSILEKENSLA